MSHTTSDGLFCRQSRWTDVAVFFLVNILAHAGTVPSYPGCPTTEHIYAAVQSIVIPFCGIGRAIRIIFTSAVFAGSPLQKAAWADAICVVGRTRHWRADDGVVLSPHGSHVFFTDQELPRDSEFILQRTHSPRKCQVHGQHHLTPSYTFYVPSHQSFIEFPPPSPLDGPPPQVMLPSNHSLIKPLLSIIQITYGSFEIYRTRWDQLTNYGYGAYYLICIPYIIMSFVNLVAALVCPEYPCVFLAESPIMQEARARGCTFNGTIGLADIGSSDPAGPSEPTEPAGGPSPEWQGLLLVSSRTPGISDPSRSAPDEALPPIQLLAALYGPSHRRDTRNGRMHFMGIIAILLVPLAIGVLFLLIGLSTNFKAGQSTIPQRLWLLVWVPVNLIGCCVGLSLPEGFGTRDVSSGDVSLPEILPRAILLALVGVLTVWVFVEAGRGIVVSEVCKVV